MYNSIRFFCVYTHFLLRGNHPNNLQNFGYLKNRIAAAKLLFLSSHDLIEIALKELLFHNFCAVSIAL